MLYSKCSAVCREDLPLVRPARLLPRKTQKEKERSVKLGLALGEAIIIDAWRRNLRAWHCDRVADGDKRSRIIGPSARSLRAARVALLITTIPT